MSNPTKSYGLSRIWLNIIIFVRVSHVKKIYRSNDLSQTSFDTRMRGRRIYINFAHITFLNTKTQKNTKTMMICPICPNLNSREFDRRELFRFFGHNSGPSWAFLTKIGDIIPITLPDLSDSPGASKKKIENPKFKRHVRTNPKNIHDHENWA